MKKLIYAAMLIPGIVAFSSCEVETPTWKGIERINFFTDKHPYYFEPLLSDTIRYYTFAFEADEVTQTTVWIEVETEGFVYDFPRPVKISIDNSYGINDAVPNTHYIDFEDGRVRDDYFIPAGQSKTSLPVVLLRSPDLKDRSVHLRIGFAANEYFQPGYADYRSHRTIVITDRLSKPDLWDDLSRYFGEYGMVKHQFMIDASGRMVNDDYLQEILKTEDSNYYRYLRDWFQMKLDEENERRAGLVPPLEPLTEKDGTIVFFYLKT